ncbi:MAG: type II toxin-antitoxin system Phd/YefM family antitoxin [Armatimonadetes bacterium]|nr:type II toxin-antitoxin system Phd/YefM family antitoxin [Armatimonadota bacterium]
MSRTLSVAEAKSSFSAVVDRVASERDRVIISRRGKPLAALIPLEELEELERLRAAQGAESLAAVAGQWEGFEEIVPFVEDAYASRQRTAGRSVSLE